MRTALHFSTAVVAALLPFGAAAQALRYPSVEYWSRPENVNAFLGTYGFLSPLEPVPTSEERALFRSVVEQLKLEGGRATALQLLTSALKPDSTASLDFTLANLHAEMGQLDQAVMHYRNAIRKAPNFLRAYKNLGLFLCQKGSFDDAIPALVKAANLGSADSITFGLLGLCYLNTGRLLAAEAAYRSAVVFDPATFDWKLGLARSLIEQQKFTEAIVILDEILKARPDDVTLWMAQASAYLGLNEPRKAAANFEIIRRMGKATGESLLLLGDIYMNENLRDLALDLYLEALKLDANQPVERLVRAAEILVARNALEQATRLLAQIQESFAGRLKGDDELKVLKLESRVAIARGETDRAAGILEQIVERNPLDGEALLLLARHYNQKDEVARAEIYYDRAAKIREFEADALVAHAQMLVGKGEFAKAMPLLERAQTIRPRENVGRYLQQVRNAAQSATSF